MKDETLSIVGRIDCFDPDEKDIIDAKSTRRLEWQLEKRIVPRARDILKIRSYGTIWKSHGFPVNRLLLVYMDERTPPRTFEINQIDLTEWLRTRVIRLHKAILTQIPPEAEPNSLCRFCPFKETYCCGDQ
jgi:CRISPR/Cas system-associated exonuclease Cas4 (RecB family)